MQDEEIQTKTCPDDVSQLFYCKIKCKVINTNHRT